MNWNNHYNLAGKHAFLGASKYHWLNYDVDKVRNVYLNSLAIERGTKLHNYAAESIELGINLPRNSTTLNMYVNDAIGYRMTPEQVLYYSPRCFGTADAISFRKNLLRIHDLKTGSTPAHMEQLMIYAALFCLEYQMNPKKIKIELRIYQNNEIQICKPEAEDILPIMDKIVEFDAVIANVEAEANGR